MIFVADNHDAGNDNDGYKTDRTILYEMSDGEEDADQNRLFPK